MTRASVRPRSGFTLIELIIVMAIIAILATLTVLFIPKLDRNKGVENAVTQLHGWVSLGRDEANRDGKPRGIRCVLDSDGRVTSLQYIEQPEPLAPRGPNIRAFISTPNPNPMGPPPIPNPVPTTVTLARVDATGTPVALIMWDGVSAGDFFELTVAPYGVYQILSVGGLNNSQLTLMPGRSVEGTEPPPYGATLVLANGFRVIRQPRPLVGEPMLQLNKDVYIEPAWCFPCPSGAPGHAFTWNSTWSVSDVPGAHFDILFNASGQVAGAPTGLLILSIRHIDRPNDRIFLVINSRTGKIAPASSFELQPDGSATPGVDPYLFARDGKSSGL